MKNICDKDKELFDKIFKDKSKYAIQIDNDDVSVFDKNELDKFKNGEWIEPNYDNFNEYGYELLNELFVYLGFDSELV